MIILYDNAVSSNATLTASNEDPLSPLENLYDTRLSRSYRTLAPLTTETISVEVSAILSGWTHRTADGSYAGTFFDATYGNGLHVIVGSGGGIQTSADGITWEERTADGSYSGNFRGITYGNNLYVAVGDTGEIQTSADGITWAARTADGAYASAFYSAAYGNNLYVIVGVSGEIQTSADGITWAARTADGAYAGTFRAATYGNSLYVIAGNTGEIQTSADGITWAARTADGGFSSIFYGLTYGNSLYVIVGSSGEIQTSADGITWAARTAGGGFSNGFQGATYGNNLYVIVGLDSEIQTSADGITWISGVAEDSFSGTFFGVSYGNNLYVAVGDTGEIQTSGYVMAGGGSFHCILVDHNVSSSATTYLEASTESAFTSTDLFSTTIPWSSYTMYTKISDSTGKTNWRVRITDQSTATSYINIGHLRLSTGLQMPGMKPDQTIKDETTAKVDISHSGQAYGNSGYDYRSPTVNFPYVSSEERANFRTMWQTVHNYIPVSVIFWANSTNEELPLYGIINQNSLDWKRTDDTNYRWATSIKFRETY